MQKLKPLMVLRVDICLQDEIEGSGTYSNKFYTGVAADVQTLTQLCTFFDKT